MPLESYLLIHKDAKLTPQQKELLVTYFNTMKDVTMITNKISEEELKPKKQTLDFKRKILYFYDGDCGFCNFWVQWILKNDKKDNFFL
jgi:hypothetical protein